MSVLPSTPSLSLSLFLVRFFLSSLGSRPTAATLNSQSQSFHPSLTHHVSQFRVKTKTRKRRHHHHHHHQELACRGLVRKEGRNELPQSCKKYQNRRYTHSLSLSFSKRFIVANTGELVFCSFIMMIIIIINVTLGLDLSLSTILPRLREHATGCIIASNKIPLETLAPIARRS